MIKKKLFILTFFFIFFLILFFNISNKKEIEKKNKILPKENIISSSSNIILDVSYLSEDAKGNKYEIKAKKGEIDISNTNIVFLTDVTASIYPYNSGDIKIKSDFGKHNINNYDTIFSKNIIIEYLENKIVGELLEFSLIKNILIISKNVIFTNDRHILKADSLEINITSKDAKIFMHEKGKKINIKNKN